MHVNENAHEKLNEAEKNTEEEESCRHYTSKSVINVRATLHDKFLENDDVHYKIGSSGSRRGIMSTFTFKNGKAAHLGKIRTVLTYTFSRRSSHPEVHIIHYTYGWC